MLLCEQQNMGIYGKNYICNKGGFIYALTHLYLLEWILLMNNIRLGLKKQRIFEGERRQARNR